jgi:hydrogenase maturation protease
VEPTLIIGYGNLDRQDDGVAWHVLTRLANRLHLPAAASPEEIFPTTEGIFPHLLFDLQLVPEFSETISRYQKVCFIDAHTGRIPEDVKIAPIVPVMQSSPFTHHMTPETCLSLARTLYNSQVKGVLVSIKGFEFGFSHTLSSQTYLLADHAVQMIESWLNNTNSSLL